MMNTQDKDTKPKMTDVELATLIESKGMKINLTKHPMWIVGIRGYYKDSMGVPRVNDRGIYDDAIFIYSADCFRSLNGNTDPSKIRAEYGTRGETKGMAKLQAGLWTAFRFGLHKGQYLALCQRANVIVIRDGIVGKDCACSGLFGINIHKGGYSQTSSEGCQTIYPERWAGSSGFITIAQQLAVDYFGERWDEVLIPYALMEM